MVPCWVGGNLRAASRTAHAHLSRPVNTGSVEPTYLYTQPLTPGDLPAEVRALLDPTRPLQEPPQQGRTSRVALATAVSGGPVVLKRSAGRHLDVLRREHRALRLLFPLGIPTPESILFLERLTAADPEGWLVTRRLRGTTLEAALRTAPDQAHRMSLLKDFGTALARLHATPPPLGFGNPDWLENALAVAESLNPGLDAGRVEQLRRERPTPRATTLIHGDLFLDNVMTEDGHVTGFIDWAFADVGDPRYDVAVATHDLTRAEREAFAESYGPAAQLTAQEAAYFVEVALLF